MFLSQIFESDLKDYLYPKWKGILNPPICSHVLSKLEDSFCGLNNVALIFPTNQFYDGQIKCPVYELSGFFHKQYASFPVSKGFKHKEKFNQAYLKMQEVGIVDRVTKISGMKKDPLKNFQDHYSDKYNVVDEGVMFEHVKIIVIGYFMFLPIPLLVLLIEILIHKYKHRMLRILYRYVNNLPIFKYVN